MQNTRKLITEDHADVIVGSVTTPVAIAMADVCVEGKTPQLMLSPANLPPGKDGWSFRMPQSTAVMAIPIVEHWKKIGVKTYGFLGYSDGYGEAWLTDIKPLADKAGIKLVDTERFARADTSVTGQALKLVAANPDAILVVASGSGAAMPHKGLVERGYAKSKIYQTHGAATLDLIRVGGADVDGSFVSSGPAVVAEQLPASNASKALGMQFKTAFEAANGKGSANQFARPRLRRHRRPAEGGADRAQEGQARHAGVPPGAEGRVRDDGPHAGVAGRPQLDDDRPLRLPARDRRAAEGGQRRLAGPALIARPSPIP